eukprot:Opistho-1_new@106205
MPMGSPSSKPVWFAACAKAAAGSVKSRTPLFERRRRLDASVANGKERPLSESALTLAPAITRFSASIVFVPFSARPVASAFAIELMLFWRRSAFSVERLFESTFKSSPSVPTKPAASGLSATLTLSKKNVSRRSTTSSVAETASASRLAACFVTSETALLASARLSSVMFATLRLLRRSATVVHCAVSTAFHVGLLGPHARVCTPTKPVAQSRTTTAPGLDCGQSAPETVSAGHVAAVVGLNGMLTTASLPTVAPTGTTSPSSVVDMILMPTPKVSVSSTSSSLSTVTLTTTTSDEPSSSTNVALSGSKSRPDAAVPERVWITPVTRPNEPKFGSRATRSCATSPSSAVAVKLRKPTTPNALSLFAIVACN